MFIGRFSIRETELSVDKELIDLNTRSLDAGLGFYLSGPKQAVFSVIFCDFSVEVSNEKKLIRDLLGAYAQVTRHGRPVVNDSTTLNVQFGLGLIQMELDEKEKALSLSLWAKYVSTTSL